MPFEYQILILLIACVLVALFVQYLNRKEAETSEGVFWANVAQPLIYEQPDATMQSQQATKDAYQNAVGKIKEHGNMWIADRDIHLFVWGADDKNTAVDFQQWALLNVSRRAKIHERFRQQKAEQAARFNAIPGMANVYSKLPDFDDINENGNGQKS